MDLILLRAENRGGPNQKPGQPEARLALGVRLFYYIQAAVSQLHMLSGINVTFEWRAASKELKAGMVAG
jgi:hypothetical protein